jgi:predicted nucleotidyltransferase
MRTGAPALLPLFRSEMQVELLALLFLQPGRAWTLGGLSSTLGATQSSVHKELRRLLDAGLVRRDTRHRPHSYEAAEDSPAYKPLRELLALTAGVGPRLAAVLAHVDGVYAAAIHGSWAAGRVRPDSDLDVLVIADGDRRAVQQAARAVGRRIRRDVDATVITPERLRDLVAHDNPFIRRILNGPREDVIGNVARLAEDIP